MKNRRIKVVLKSKPVLEGAGVLLKRALGFHETPQFDPFLLMDDFRSDQPSDYIRGFPWHPHRGIETITYVLSGDVEHGDSLGNKGVISSGDVQWMTAGSGIIHQEMPKGDAKGRMYGFQLWANLPAANKMMPPRYREVRAGDIPEVVLENGSKVKIVSGKFQGVQGPVKDVVTDPVYLDVTVPKGQTLQIPVAKGHTVFAYVIEGQAHFCDNNGPFTYESDSERFYQAEGKPQISNTSVVLFEDGENVYIQTDGQDCRFLLLSGKPIGEPIAWYGPIVMNTQEELRVAFDEYENGTFIKNKSQ